MPAPATKIYTSSNDNPSPIMVEEGNAAICQPVTAVKTEQNATTEPSLHVRTSGTAVASLVCGIVGLFCCGLCLGPIAICLGVQARREIQRASRGQQQQVVVGDCQAVGGLVTGSAALVVWFCLTILFVLALIGWAIEEDEADRSGSNFTDWNQTDLDPLFRDNIGGV